MSSGTKTLSAASVGGLLLWNLFLQLTIFIPERQPSDDSYKTSLTSKNLAYLGLDCHQCHQFSIIWTGQASRLLDSQNVAFIGVLRYLFSHLWLSLRPGGQASSAFLKRHFPVLSPFSIFAVFVFGLQYICHLQKANSAPRHDIQCVATYMTLCECSGDKHAAVLIKHLLFYCKRFRPAVLVINVITDFCASPY